MPMGLVAPPVPMRVELVSFVPESPQVTLPFIMARAHDPVMRSPFRFSAVRLYEFVERHDGLIFGPTDYRQSIEFVGPKGPHQGDWCQTPPNIDGGITFEPFLDCVVQGEDFIKSVFHHEFVGVKI